MMITRLSCVLILVMVLSLPFSALAGDFEVEVAREKIDVTVGFDGSSIEVFGDRRDKDTIVAIAIEGPKTDITIWQKARVLGTWVNRHFVKFGNVPKYYSYSQSGDAHDEKTRDILFNLGVGNDAVLMNAKISKSKSIKDIEPFKKAFLEKKVTAGLYANDPAEIRFINDNFFRVSFEIPPSATTGEYAIRSFLIKDGTIYKQSIDSMTVEQVGLNAFINKAAYDYSFIYAAVCIFLALFSGWLISALRVRP